MTNGIVVPRGTAERIWSILVRYAGATDGGLTKDLFFYDAVYNGIHEFRFGGSLGLGGKIWFEYSRDGVTYRVSSYNDTPKEREIVEMTNKALSTVPSVCLYTRH